MKKQITLKGKITKIEDYSPESMLNNMPVKSRSQIIGIELDDVYMEILRLRGKKVNIIFEN